MKQPQEISAKSIKDRIASVEDTYYGEMCNVSLNNDKIIRLISKDGEPMRFVSIAISLCRAGEISSEVNLVPQTVGAGCLELFSAGSIYRYLSMTDDCSMIGMTFMPFHIKEIMKTIPSRYQFGETRKVMLNEKEMAMFENMSRTYLEALEYYGEQADVTKSMASCIIQFSLHAIENNSDSNTLSSSRSDELCRSFVKLLKQTMGTRRSIGYFAEQLCVSNHYLSIAVKQSSGQSVKSLIDKSVVTEIKLLLLHSDLTVSQIADRLEFPNHSFLCRYFKTHTGMSPLQYRKRK